MTELVSAVDAALARYPGLEWERLTHEEKAAAINAELRRIKARGGSIL